MQKSLKKLPKAALPAIRNPSAIYTYPDGAAVYAGSDPPEAADNLKPVIVFVPGLGQVASSFWNSNSIYESAYINGFRTAFVSFCKPHNLAQDMWSDGEMLARQLGDICGYFNVPRVVIVAHSKGGVDSQTAAVFFGASSHIDSIITLSTPHHGSQLADIAYSATGWSLAELLKVHSPGCFSMQTGYMRAFRGMADKNPQNSTPIKTFAGNGGENEPLRIIAGSLFLSRYGENDGVVTVESAHNPLGEHMGTLHLCHEQMADGRYVWPYLAPVLNDQTLQPAAAAFAPVFTAPPAQIIKGGKIGHGVNEYFYVDSTVESFKITITLAGRNIHRYFVLQSPSGHKNILYPKRNESDVFLIKSSVDNPQVGKWKLMSPRGNGAYCAVVSLCGKNVFAVCPKTVNSEKLGTQMRILRTYTDGYDIVGEYDIKNGIELSKPPNLTEGIYNVEMNIKGELDDGSTYERSVFRPAAGIADIIAQRNHAVVSKNDI